VTLDLRRFGIAGATSVALHALFVVVVLTLDAPFDSGFEFSIPVELELGLTDAQEVETAPLPETAPDEPPSTSEGQGATPVGVGADAGVPSDAGGDGGRPDAGRRRRRDAGADVGPLVATSAGGDGTSPVAFLPAGAQIALRIDMDRIRASPLRGEVESLLAAIPDWDAVLGGSGIEPVRDLSRVLIATPNFQRQNIVVAGALTPDAPAPREVAERVAAANGHALEWSDEDGVESAPFYSPDGYERRVAILDDRHVVLSRPEDLPRVLAIASARTTDAETSPADALLSMNDGEAVSVEAEGIAAFVRRSPCEIARRARLAMVQAEDGVTLVGEAHFDTAEHAESARQCFDDLRVRYAANVLVQAMGFSAPLYEIELETDDTTLHVRGALSQDQLRRILDMLRGLLDRPPPPRVTPPPPSSIAPPAPTAVILDPTLRPAPPPG
jgi:hypothetical protein